MRLGYLPVSALLLLTLLSPARAQDAAPDAPPKLRGFTMSQNFSFGGSTYTYRLSIKDLENTPSWNPSRDEPPVSLRKALEVAATNLRRFVKDTDAWEVEHLNLKQLGTEKWIYEVSFTCLYKGCAREADSSFIILVKLDGSVVEPEVTPYRQPDK